jgi:deoxyribose-phosphate aldolase
MDTDDFASRIDHTLLDKDASEDEYKKVAQQAESLGTNICVPPCYVELVSGVTGEVVSVIGFPHGTTTPETKAKEAREVIRKGATELDVAVNVSLLKSGEKERFRQDVAKVADTGVTTKSIIETGLLTDEEKRLAARLSVDAGADYIKTCTGYSLGEATLKDVSIINNEVGDEAKVKASGGIGSLEKAMELIEAGASRIGASSGDLIVKQHMD